MAEATNGANAARVVQYLNTEAKTLNGYGRDHGNNVHLVASIVLRRKLLDFAVSDSERGAANDGLGNALQTLGKRERGSARLEEAVEAYRLALQERTREGFSLDWATTQNNLGAALQTLGERDSGAAGSRRRSRPIGWRYRRGRASGFRSTGRRRRAISATPSGGWANGSAERRGSRRLSRPIMRPSRCGCASGFARMGGDAKQSRQRASNARPVGERNSVVQGRGRGLSRGARGTDPRAGSARLGADAKQSRPCALGLGERESGTARLEEAVAAYRLALQERTRERVPLDWAGTQNNLGLTLSRLAERESGTARLEEAVATYHAALEERTRTGSARLGGNAEQSRHCA